MAKKKNEEETIDEVSEAGAVLPVSDGADDATDPVSDEASSDEADQSDAPPEEGASPEIDLINAGQEPSQSDDPGSAKLPTRGPLAKKVRCFNEGCGWSGVLAEMKVDERLKRPHYCPKCGYSSKIEDVEG